MGYCVAAGRMPWDHVTSCWHHLRCWRVQLFSTRIRCDARWLLCTLRRRLFNLDNLDAGIGVALGGVGVVLFSCFTGIAICQVDHHSLQHRRVATSSTVAMQRAAVVLAAQLRRLVEVGRHRMTSLRHVHRAARLGNVLQPLSSTLTVVKCRLCQIVIRKIISMKLRYSDH